MRGLVHTACVTECDVPALTPPLPGGAPKKKSIQGGVPHWLGHAESQGDQERHEIKVAHSRCSRHGTSEAKRISGAPSVAASGARARMLRKRFDGDIKLDRSINNSRYDFKLRPAFLSKKWGGAGFHVVPYVLQISNNVS